MSHELRCRDIAERQSVKALYGRYVMPFDRRYVRRRWIAASYAAATASRCCLLMAILIIGGWGLRRLRQRQDITFRVTFYATPPPFIERRCHERNIIVIYDCRRAISLIILQALHHFAR